MSTPKPAAPMDEFDVAAKGWYRKLGAGEVNACNEELAAYMRTTFSQREAVRPAADTPRNPLLEGAELIATCIYTPPDHKNDRIEFVDPKRNVPADTLHVHTRDCYDDAGPSEGHPSLICGKSGTVAADTDSLPAESAAELSCGHPASLWVMIAEGKVATPEARESALADPKRRAYVSVGTCLGCEYEGKRHASPPQGAGGPPPLSAPVDESAVREWLTDYNEREDLAFADQFEAVFVMLLDFARSQVGASAPRGKDGRE